MSRIFLSYASTDRKLAEKLKAELERVGIDVWIDYEKLGIGDNLTKSINEAINEVDYLGVLLSPRSIGSIWVQKEVKYALQQERKNEKIKVLPILYEKCEMPKVIRHKLFADFTVDYDKALDALLNSLLSTNQQKLNYLKKLYPIFNHFESNINNGIWSLEWIDSLEVSGIANDKIDEFLNLIGLEAKDDKVFITAYYVLHCILRIQAGHKAWEIIFAKELLSEDDKRKLGSSMKDCSGKQNIIWGHEQLIYKIKDQIPYCSFVKRHLDTLIEEQYHAMLSYLLSFTGPGFDNLITYFIVIDRLENPGKLVNRCIEWAKNGRFDGDKNSDDAFAELLYKQINNAIEKNRNKIEPFIEALHNHIYDLLTSKSRYFKGVYHVVSMLSAEYKLIKEISVLITPVIGTYFSNWSDKERQLEILLKQAITKCVALQSNPGDNGLQHDLIKLMSGIVENDEISGFWSKTTRKYSSG